MVRRMETKTIELSKETVSKKEIVHFFNRVLLYLGEYGWRLNLVPNSSEGYCWKTRKVIDIGAESKDVK